MFTVLIFIYDNYDAIFEENKCHASLKFGVSQYTGISVYIAIQNNYIVSR
jgi:hypothetical protein